MVSKETKANADSDHAVPFNARLSAILKSRGVFQNDLAEASGLTQTAISRYVKGARIPNLETVIRIATALCKPVAARSAWVLVGLAPGRLPHGARNVLSSDGHKAHAERNRDGGLHGG